MTVGGASRRDSATGGWRGRGRVRFGRCGLSACCALLAVAALLVLASAGCGESGEDPTSDLSTASTGSVPTLASVPPTVPATGSNANTTQVAGETTSTLPDDSGGDDGVYSLGSRRNPIPLGQQARVGDWTVRVAGVTPDATQAVLDENMFNDQPGPGTQYVLVRLEATYDGDESSTFWISMLSSFVGDEGDTFGVAAAVAPDSMIDQGEVVKGGMVSGNLVFLVDSTQVSGGTLMLEEAFDWEQGRVFFAVE